MLKALSRPAFSLLDWFVIMVFSLAPVKLDTWWEWAVFVVLVMIYGTCVSEKLQKKYWKLEAK